MVGYPYAICIDAADMPCFQRCFEDKDSHMGLGQWQMLEIGHTFFVAPCACVPFGWVRAIADDVWFPLPADS